MGPLGAPVLCHARIGRCGVRSSQATHLDRNHQGAPKSVHLKILVNWIRGSANGWGRERERIRNRTVARHQKLVPFNPGHDHHG